ncbi:hypothetical protein EVJ58_g5996 [Rhodofomes roseus]|uniref:Uncharacterized protein n=1 Tax=Rhodofomes roseus TaxID=34475 RepID=A0A4Y9YBY4_9APHY|nr:hypothetical protein EVJ58_g5996 [Rhodofomes roseus]
MKKRLRPSAGKMKPPARAQHLYLEGVSPPEPTFLFLSQTLRLYIIIEVQVPRRHPLPRVHTLFQLPAQLRGLRERRLSQQQPVRRGHPLRPALALDRVREVCLLSTLGRGLECVRAVPAVVSDVVRHGIRRGQLAGEEPARDCKEDDDLADRWTQPAFTGASAE